MLVAPHVDRSPPTCPCPSPQAHCTLPDPVTVHEDRVEYMSMYSSAIGCGVPPTPCRTSLVLQAPGSIATRFGLSPKYRSTNDVGAPHKPAEMDRRSFVSKSRKSKLSKSAKAPAPISVIRLSRHQSASSCVNPGKLPVGMEVIAFSSRYISITVTGIPEGTSTRPASEQSTSSSSTEQPAAATSTAPAGSAPSQTPELATSRFKEVSMLEAHRRNPAI